LASIAASHTFTSGKFNEVVDLFIRQIERLSSFGRHHRSVQAEPPPDARQLGLLYGALNTGEDELPGGAPFAGGSFP
jgi:hypothetical protein